jgi:hypothetical protein
VRVTRSEKALALLDEWLSEPDDLGPEWWAEFEADLQRSREHDAVADDRIGVGADGGAERDRADEVRG